MPRIFKGSESTLRLLISKTGDYQALTEIKIKLYTTDIENAIEIIDGIQVCKNIAIITLAPRAFMGMEDGLINYIIDGATEDDVFHTERQSNYYLKSLSYINEDGVATQTMTIESNGEYRVTPNDGLYVDINVDVIPKINIQETGIKLAYGTFTEVPEWADFDGITNMVRMFSECLNLQTIPEINTSGVTNMERMFYNCGIQTIPFLDTSNVINANSMFYYCSNLKTLPNNFNFSNCTNMGTLFRSASLTDYSFLETWVINPNANMDEMINNTNTTYVPAIPCVGNTNRQQSAIFWSYGDFSKLTYFGGWIGRKYNVDKDNILKKIPNLTYESCISILNNLYDFTGNGETPDSNQGKLKVHQNFLDAVGNEISIGTNKGWQITV